MKNTTVFIFTEKGKCSFSSSCVVQLFCFNAQVVILHDNSPVTYTWYASVWSITINIHSTATAISSIENLKLLITSNHKGFKMKLPKYMSKSHIQIKTSCLNHISLMKPFGSVFFYVCNHGVPQEPIPLFQSS